MKTVHWKNHDTNETGYGLPLDDAEADMWARIQHKKHPATDYWTEPFEDGDKS